MPEMGAHSHLFACAAKQFSSVPLVLQEALTKAQQVDVMVRLTAGESVAKVARDFGTTRQSIMRVRARHVSVGATGSP
ncbi:hypothetical protein F1735_33630 [Massilia sp. CCM 8694]|uniref:Resolvase HTH domain-containing protein n=1 Tax=Massilia genomosp. 1 TaxID=2609280 RepID=A0ABX0MWJ8_9BURK|nr:hypothetical protein [Massilia genomosp. 1]